MGRVPDRIARYEVERELGSGGMGTVYLACDPDLGRRRVAIKLIQAQLDSPELRERFAREALTVATLNHPHIVTVYDSGQYESRPYLVLEYIQGRPLARVIAIREPVPIGTRLSWLEELCDGLAFAHEAGVVHRDIKPANVMLDHLDRLKILDFGIARMAGGVSMAMSGPIGTPGFMAPEYIREESWDERIDIFAAGAVAYELLSYRPAFPGDSAATVLHRVMTSDPAALEAPSLNPALGADLDAVVRRALEKRPEDRYPQARQFKEALRAIRERLERAAPDRTTPIERPEPARDAPERRRTPATPNRNALDEAVRRRRDHLIRTALARAEAELAHGRLDDAMAACIEAATLDEGRPDTLETTARVQQAIDAREAEGLLSVAQQELERGALTAARDAVESARALCRSVSWADSFEQEIARKQNERETERQRAQQFRSLMSEARASFAVGDLPAALASVQSAVHLNPQSTQALDLERTLESRIEERERIEQENRRARVAKATVAAPPIAQTIAAPAAARDRRRPVRRSRLQVVGAPIAALVVVLTAGLVMLWRDPADSAATPGVPPSPGVQVLDPTADLSPVVPASPVTAEPDVSRPPDPPPLSNAVRPSRRPIPDEPYTAPTPTLPSSAPVPVPPPQTNAAPSAALVEAKGLLARGAFVEALAVLEREGSNSPEAAALIDAARQGVRDLAQDSVAAAKSQESAGNWSGALERYQRANQLGPSAAVNDAIARVGARMKEEATDALTRARQYDALDRVDDAVLWYERALRNLLDDDPAKKVARERLDGLRNRR